MKNKVYSYIKTLIVSVLFLSLPSQIYSQDYKLVNDTSSIIVSGTSTLHDWHVDGENQSGSLSFSEAESFNINELSFRVKAESLKSGKNSMDKNTYKALNTDKYKDIVFSYTKTNSVVKKGEGHYMITASGKLTISGVTKTIDLDLEVFKDGDLVKINGKKDMLMTDFGIDPPKALLGTIKTGNEITITYKSVFKK